MIVAICGLAIVLFACNKTELARTTYIDFEFTINGKSLNNKTVNYLCPMARFRADSSQPNIFRHLSIGYLGNEFSVSGRMPDN